MKEFDLNKLARYPFLKEAKDYVASLNLTLDGIRGHPLYCASVDLGRQRAQDALKGTLNPNMDDRLSRELTILSYAIARILVNLTKNRILISRYASVEAENSYGFLIEESEEILREIMDDLDLELDSENRMHFSKYLGLCTHLAKSDAKWRLVNRIIEGGYVQIEETEIPLLLREAIRIRVMEPIGTKGIPDEFKKISAEFSLPFDRKRGDVKIEQVDEGALPPCIQGMLTSLQLGSASHNGMFILGTFFLGLGLNADGVVRVFSRHPNFNEEKTRYQLEFLTGEKGTTQYSCPSCAKIKSYGLCKGECGVKHPLQYYRSASARGI
jgi:DNA primase large subunit